MQFLFPRLLDALLSETYAVGAEGEMELDTALL